VRWQAHVAVAVVLIVLASAAFGFPAPVSVSLPFAMLVLACAVSSMVPDLDHERSKGSRSLFIFLCLAAVVLAASATLTSISPDAVFNFAIYSLAQIGALFLIIKVLRPKHRGITHSLSALVLFASVVFLISRSPQVTFACFLGYLSHLLADFEIKLA
jgi:membrane-bound metal-dependent hydrolase YbcI (DUF457 family)